MRLSGSFPNVRQHKFIIIPEARLNRGERFDWALFCASRKTKYKRLL